jgi:hypothetical protein
VEPDRATRRSPLGLSSTVALPIATTAAVGEPGHDFRVEAMEDWRLLRACELAGVPAVEVRISGRHRRGDRERWMIRGLEVLGAAMPPARSAVPVAFELVAGGGRRRGPCGGALWAARWEQLVAESIRLYGAQFERSRSGSSSRS